jgi:uncharacterized damage-inducible protein DinB
MTIAQKLLAEMDEEFAGTRKFLELVPDDKLMWKPHEKSMELGYLAWHISDTPGWCHEAVTKDTLSLSEEDGAKMLQEREGKQRADILARFDQYVRDARESLAKAADADLEQHWKMEWAGQVVIDSPREQVIRKWVLNHMIHHRAQLGVYYRLLGIAIPGMYGPSADEMATEESAAAS